MHSRRWFLSESLALAVLAACRQRESSPLPRQGGGDSGTVDTAPPPVSECPPAWQMGTLLGVLPFLDEGDRTLEELTGEGLDGRYVTDLSSFEPVTLAVPAERFFVRTRASSLLPASKGWSVTLDGEVDTEVSWTADELATASVDQGHSVLECSGNTSFGGFGLLGASQWAGVPMAEVLARASSSVEWVRIEGFDTYPSEPTGSSVPGASWVFRIDDLVEAGAFLATQHNGAPLTLDHGAPVRLVVPNAYGCCCIKWVERITFVDAGAAATSQMEEFAWRTHQPKDAVVAADYRLPLMELSAVPVRVEEWVVEGERVLRVMGLVWGGVPDSLSLVVSDGTVLPVTLCPAGEGGAWAAWEVEWRPTATGDYTLRLAGPPGVPQTRLESGWYERAVSIT